MFAYILLIKPPCDWLPVFFFSVHGKARPGAAEVLGAGESLQKDNTYHYHLKFAQRGGAVKGL